METRCSPTARRCPFARGDLGMSRFKGGSNERYTSRGRLQRARAIVGESDFDITKPAMIKRSQPMPASRAIAAEAAKTRQPRRVAARRTHGVSCVDGPRLARDNFARRTEVACSHVSGLFMQSGWTAGPDGVREPRPHHSSGIDVPMKRQASLGCVGSTDCAITRHCSLASSSPSAVGD